MSLCLTLDTLAEMYRAESYPFVKRVAANKEQKMIPETLPVHMSGDQLYNMVKLYDLLRDMSFELTPEQIEVFENIQDAEVNGGFF